MPRLARKYIPALFVFALLILAASLWLGLRWRAARSQASRSRVCEEWQRAETATESLGWDLTYERLLKKNGLCPGHPFCEIVAKKTHPPIATHVAEFGDPILSAILIELPDGHAEMAASWVFRTKDHAYWQAFHPSDSRTVTTKPIPFSDYERLFETMACWRQDQQVNRAFGEKGYVGFLSLYKEGKSRQLLLTDNDLFEGNTKPDDGKPGRFFKTIEPLRAYW